MTRLKNQTGAPVRASATNMLIWEESTSRDTPDSDLDVSMLLRTSNELFLCE